MNEYEFQYLYSKAHQVKEIYSDLKNAKASGEKKFAVLIDPDKLRMGKIDSVLQLAKDANVDYFFIGGSLIVNDMLDLLIKSIKENTSIPCVLFPGNSFQLSYKADALLFLSLISGRNAELLIGNHVLAAPYLKMSPLEIISTGYMLIDGGVSTTVQYISNTRPIPAEKADIAMSTAIAGQYLGLKCIYMDAGSGAQNPISESMIDMVSSAVDIPLIVGGGIRTPEKAMANVKAGADVVVVGNAIEKDPELIIDMSAAIHSVKVSS